jgi:predicted porin
MKKSLIALAALSAFATAAQAQSSVTVYGVLDIGHTTAENKFTSTNGAVATNKVTSTGNGDGALATSRFGVRGSEDLGAGRKANFVLEYDLVDVGTGGNGAQNQGTTANTSQTTAANTAGFGARYSWVGLEDAKLGRLRLGRQEQSIHSVHTTSLAGMANNITGSIYSAGTADVSTNAATIRQHGVFLNRAVTYISPRISGFTFEAQTARQETTISGTNQNTEASENGASVKYSAGKLALAYGYANVKAQTATGDAATNQKMQALGGSYDFGVAKVFVLGTERENKLMGALVQKTKATEVGVQVPMGKTLFWASGFDGSRDGSANGTAINSFNGITTGGATNTQLTDFNKATADVSGYQVGAMYNLSKRTAVYGIYGKQEIKATTGTVAGAKVASDAMAFGVRHSF